MNPIYPMGYPYNMGYQQPMRYQTPQQRLAEMEQQYPQFASNNQGQNFMKCRAVTSIDEAKASMIDLDGSINVFTDIGNKKIYTKQMNLDGTATLKTYVLNEDNSPDQVITHSEDKNPLNEKISTLESKIKSLEGIILELREKVNQYDEHESNAVIADIQPTRQQPKSNGTDAKNVRR